MIYNPYCMVVKETQINGYEFRHSPISSIKFRIPIVYTDLRAYEGCSAQAWEAREEIIKERMMEFALTADRIVEGFKYPIKGTCYVIYASTGCTCCNDENHYRGPFSTREAAERMSQHYTDIALIASQYAPRGKYKIDEVSFEQIDDKRMIVSGDYVHNEGFMDDNPDGCRMWNYGSTR